MASSSKVIDEKADSDPSHVGAAENPLLNGSDLSTVIGRDMGDASFDESRTAKYQVRTVRSSKQALINAFKKISNMADRLNLPKIIVDRANSLFKQVHDGKIFQCGKKDAIVSSCVYIACRQEGAPRTLYEICAVSNVSKRVVGRYFKRIIKDLQISLDLLTAGDFLSRFCSNLGLPISVQRLAAYIAWKAVKLDILNGRSYITVAAAAIYMASHASKCKRSQKEIGDVVGVTGHTIQRSYRLMYPRA